MTAYANQGMYDRIKGRQGQLEKRRAMYDDQTNVIAERFRPDLVAGKIGELREGAFEGSAIVEGTGPHAARIWQRGFQNNICSRDERWFRDHAREPSDPRIREFVKFKGNDQVNRYLQNFDDAMYDLYSRSNFYDVIPHFILDGGTIGSPVMLREEDIVAERIICKVPHYSQRWLGKDIMGKDNVLHVKWKFSALEASQFFAEADLPAAVKLALTNGNHYDEAEYLQVIYGAGDSIFRDLPKKHEVAQTHPWMEFYIALSCQENEKKILKPKNHGPGYFQRPFSTWHYWRNWHEAYSRTPAWWAIYDVKGLNDMWEAIFGEAELAIRPPVWAPQALEGLLDLGPAGENYARDALEYEQPPRHLERASRYDVAIEFAREMKAAVERHFHVDLFMKISKLQEARRQPETAYGLFKADMERNSQLAPEVETFERQVLGDNHEAFIEMAKAADKLPEPPDILAQYSDSGQVDPEFMGELSRAQARDRTINNFYRNIGISELAFKWAPETVAKINWPQALERLLEAGNFPAADLIPAEQYEQLIELAQQRQMQADLAEQAPKVAQAVRNLQGRTEEGSPLKLIRGEAA
jgi:hypothetical protein